MGVGWGEWGMERILNGSGHMRVEGSIAPIAIASYCLSYCMVPGGAHMVWDLICVIKMTPACICIICLLVAFDKIPSVTGSVHLDSVVKNVISVAKIVNFLK